LYVPIVLRSIPFVKPIKLNKADQRALYSESDPAALDEFRALAVEVLERELRLARLLLRIHLKAAFVDARCSSIEDLAGRCHLDGYRARDLNQWVNGSGSGTRSPVTLMSRTGSAGASSATPRHSSWGTSTGPRPTPSSGPSSIPTT